MPGLPECGTEYAGGFSVASYCADHEHPYLNSLVEHPQTSFVSVQGLIREATAQVRLVARGVATAYHFGVNRSGR